MAGCELTNEHINEPTSEHTNKRRNEPTNKPDGSQYLLAEVTIDLRLAFLLARDSMLSELYATVTRVDQSKTVEVRIMPFSPYSSPIPLLLGE